MEDKWVDVTVSVSVMAVLAGAVWFNRGNIYDVHLMYICQPIHTYSVIVHSTVTVL